MMILNEEELVEHLFAMSDDPDSLSYQGYRRSVRQDKPIRVPEPGPVIIWEPCPKCQHKTKYVGVEKCWYCDGRGRVIKEERPMTDKELAAWRKAEGIEDE